MVVPRTVPRALSLGRELLSRRKSRTSAAGPPRVASLDETSDILSPSPFVIDGREAEKERLFNNERPVANSN